MIILLLLLLQEHTRLSLAPIHVLVGAAVFYIYLRTLVEQKMLVQVMTLDCVCSAYYAKTNRNKRKIIKVPKKLQPKIEKQSEKARVRFKQQNEVREFDHLQPPSSVSQASTYQERMIPMSQMEFSRQDQMARFEQLRNQYGAGPQYQGSHMEQPNTFYHNQTFPVMSPPQPVIDNRADLEELNALMSDTEYLHQQQSEPEGVSEISYDNDILDE